ncbi:polymorphic toxin type 50 domain-containing protein, partial [Photorhabdus laumondii]
LAEGVDPQKLLNGVHSGEYPIIRMTPRNQPIVNFGKPIGKYEGQPTNYGIIHYGKNGAHIVPANPIQH